MLSAYANVNCIHPTFLLAPKNVTCRGFFVLIFDWATSYGRGSRLPPAVVPWDRARLPCPVADIPIAPQPENAPGAFSIPWPPGSPARGFSRAPAYETTPDLTLEGSDAVHWRGNAVAGWIVFAENSATDQT